MKIVATINFSDSLDSIKDQLTNARREEFEPDERIVIIQDTVDEYTYVDAPGDKLIALQKIVNQVDISNCFIQIETANLDIQTEVEDVAKNYSSDPVPFNFKIVSGNYTRINKKYANSACRKVWDHLYVGTDHNVNPCCFADHRFPISNIFSKNQQDIIASDKGNTIRDHMSKGYRVRACKPCYDQEDLGQTTMRVPVDPSTIQPCITNMDIRINNICNFKCRMCSEYFSSAIQKETVELYGNNTVLGEEKISLTPKTLKERQQALEKIIPHISHNIKEIYFAGGEPLIIDEHYKILQHLIDIDHTDLQIKYNTNLSKLSYKKFNVIDFWKKFPTVKVSASLDASGTVAEYIRHGTVWADIIANLDIIKKETPHVNLTVSSTVGFLNIENLIKLQTNWIDSGYFTQDELSVSVLHGPILSLENTPLQHKKRLIEMIQNHMVFLGQTKLAKQWNNVLACIKSNGSTTEFAKRMRVLDTHRGENFTQVFPEFKDLYTVGE
jgi:organic radical activating enzyme